MNNKYKFLSLIIIVICGFTFYNYYKYNSFDTSLINNKLYEKLSTSTELETVNSYNTNTEDTTQSSNTTNQESSVIKNFVPIIINENGYPVLESNVKCDISNECEKNSIHEGICVKVNRNHTIRIINTSPFKKNGTVSYTIYLNIYQVVGTKILNKIIKWYNNNTKNGVIKIPGNSSLNIKLINTGTYSFVSTNSSIGSQRTLTDKARDFQVNYR